MVVNKISFPRIIAFLCEDGVNVPNDTVGTLKAALKRKEGDSRVILSYSAGDQDLSRLAQLYVGQGVESYAFDAGSETEMIEACDSQVFFGNTQEHERLLTYARALGRHICLVSRKGKFTDSKGCESQNRIREEYFFHFRQTTESADEIKLDPKVQRFPI